MMSGMLSIKIGSVNASRNFDENREAEKKMVLLICFSWCGNNLLTAVTKMTHYFFFICVAKIILLLINWGPWFRALKMSH